MLTASAPSMIVRTRPRSALVDEVVAGVAAEQLLRRGGVGAVELRGGRPRQILDGLHQQASAEAHDRRLRLVHPAAGDLEQVRCATGSENRESPAEK